MTCAKATSKVLTVLQPRDALFRTFTHLWTSGPEEEEHLRPDTAGLRLLRQTPARPAAPRLSWEPLEETQQGIYSHFTGWTVQWCGGQGCHLNEKEKEFWCICVEFAFNSFLSQSKSNACNIKSVWILSFVSLLLMHSWYNRFRRTFLKCFMPAFEWDFVIKYESWARTWVLWAHTDIHNVS